MPDICSVSAIHFLTLDAAVLVCILIAAIAWAIDQKCTLRALTRGDRRRM